VLGPDEVEGCPRSFEDLGVEELDATESDGNRNAFPLLDVLDVKEVVAQILFADLIG